jgi:hypothetical protein
VARGKCSFKESDITRAVRAVTNAGVEVKQVEIDIDGGKIIVVAGKPADNQIINPWDEVLRHAADAERPS